MSQIRLQGLDMARFLAFVGMVIVNFKIVMGAEIGTGWAATFGGLLEGRAAASFVVLAGIGLGLAYPIGGRPNRPSDRFVIIKRAVFLMIAGLLNMLIFEADILHYYAVYFLFGAALLGLGNRALFWSILAINIVFVTMLFTLDYEAGWDWANYAYPEFWTPIGFFRNLFFNGWHPVFPWLSFLLVGIILSRLPLHTGRTQARMVGFGAACIALAEGIAAGMRAMVPANDAELAEIMSTSVLPPMPFYVLAGTGAACILIGLCLWLAPRLPALSLFTAAGRQTLTLYLAHILIGMGTLEILGMTQNQTPAQSLQASLLFCALAALYAWLWSRFFKRGPVEALMRRLCG